jgi:hypothetical protein
MFKEQLYGAIRFGQIYILILFKIVGEKQAFFHLIGVHTLLTRINEKIQD